MVSRLPVLTDISVKVPDTMYASNTNCLIYHPFILDNPNYRAHARLPPLSSETDASLDVTEGTEQDIWGLSFTPLTENDLIAGHLVKERFIKVLDHPALTNHLLKNRNLLAVLVGGTWVR
jgi:hypothetical protein